MKRVLVTGGAGFIGSNFIRYFLARNPDVDVINFDKLTYAGNLENLADVESNTRYHFVKGDICERSEVESVFKKFGFDSVVHFAAESHVDRSILGSSVFVQTNVAGTHVVLDVAKECGIRRFLHVSTDEVYGSLGSTGKFTEETPLHPNSPYSASKAGSDLLALAYHHTHGVPVIVTRCSNNYGPYQFPEKLIPLMIINALNDKPLPVYGDGLNVRDWLHVVDHCGAIEAVLQSGKPGEVYNIGGNNEWKNIDIVKLILQKVGKPESLIRFVKDRPGHDRRYAIDAAKIKNEIGWTPSYTFERGIEETVQWYLNNRNWWSRVMTGEYQEYYQKQYDEVAKS
ncbi:MAG: dTDP-glucose 4,6-dehydratase [Bacteroidetes bacterium]|nr:dTDP-glucose 4,6-dehydratase [Bacteroidota bacterium]MCW5895361.1 dTDP-glucose 4,6-dehydratase [Bacteroidota bacterium]